MLIDVLGHRTYAYTGGQPYRPELPTAVFIHGVLCDHSVWALQSRYLAHHGWNVLAVDLPGHCRSAGEAPASVEAAADFVVALLDAVGAPRAALIGHSWGSLIALQAAAQLGARASHLALVGTASPMKVAPALLQSALDTPDEAIRTVQIFSRSTLAPPNGVGAWVFGAGMALGRRVLASNLQTNLLHRGFTACNSYTGGEDAIRTVQCPVLFALGAQDQMTPPRAAQPLINAAKAAGKTVQVVHLPSGHNQMTEAPDATLDALQDFLAR